MGAKIISGKDFSLRLRKKISKKINELNDSKDKVPRLDVVLVGNDPASEIYVKSKSRHSIEVGMQSFQHQLPSEVSEEDLLQLIQDLNTNELVDGILVQLPLPTHINSHKVINTINPNKDVDGFHITNVGLFNSGQQAMIPCTPLGCILLLKDFLGDLTGLNALVVGRSNIVGKPMAQLLLKENCTVTIAHSRTKNLEYLCQEADILVAAVGIPEYIQGEWIKPGSTVIDVGINRRQSATNPSKKIIVGDVDFDQAVKVAGAITPVPGGVGPMTIACLLANTTIAFCRRNKLEEPNLS